MNPSNPDWYDALQGEPLKSRSFTRELAAKIQTQVIHPSNPKRITFRRLSIFSVGVVCVAAIMLLANEHGFLQLGNSPGIQQAQMTGSGGPSGANAFAEGGEEGVEPTDMAEVEKSDVTFEPTDEATVEQEDSIVIGDRGFPIMSLTTPTDSQWQALINQSYPELATEMLYKETVGDDITLIFSKKMSEVNGYTGISIVTDKFVWEYGGWSRKARFVITPNEAGMKETLEKGLYSAFYGTDVIPNSTEKMIYMFAGIVIDPQITQIRVKDKENAEYMANLLHNDDGFTYWFVALPPQENVSSTVEGLDENGHILTSENFSNHYGR